MRALVYLLVAYGVCFVVLEALFGHGTLRAAALVVLITAIFVVLLEIWSEFRYRQRYKRHE